MNDRWIWITRWDDFQHYTPERDRPPAWIKTYTKQLDDDRYTALTPRRRALLHDLRLAFGRTSGRLSDNTLTLSRRVVGQVRRDDIDSLVQAGLIEIVSRETLDQRLEKLYSDSRANSRPRTRPRGREEEVLRTSKTALESRLEKSGDSRAAKKGNSADGPALILDMCGGCGELRPLPDDVYCIDCLATKAATT